MYKIMLLIKMLTSRVLYLGRSHKVNVPNINYNNAWLSAIWGHSKSLTLFICPHLLPLLRNCNATFRKKI